MPRETTTSMPRPVRVRTRHAAERSTKHRQDRDALRDLGVGEIMVCVWAPTVYVMLVSLLVWWVM